MELDRLLKLLVEKYIRSGKKAEKEPEPTNEKEKNTKMPKAVQEDVNKRNAAGR